MYIIFFCVFFKSSCDGLYHKRGVGAGALKAQPLFPAPAKKKLKLFVGWFVTSVC